MVTTAERIPTSPAPPPADDVLEAVVTVNEAAGLLGVSHARVYALLYKGRLRGRKAYGYRGTERAGVASRAEWLIDRSSVELYAATAVRKPTSGRWAKPAPPLERLAAPTPAPTPD